MSQDSTQTDELPEVNFEGLRNAITPINLMFDGRLCKDLKGLTGHITQATKRVNRERPDYQGALIEINLLESAFNSAVTQWEQKLTSEIQRLKNSVVSANTKSLGATKKITKFQEELTRGRASTRSMPIRIGQVRNQLLRASGHSSPASQQELQAQSRLAEKEFEFPQVYRSAAEQIVRKTKQREASIVETATKILKNLSKPSKDLGEQEIHCGKLYWLHSLEPFMAGGTTPDVAADMFQFVEVCGLNDSKDAYVLRSFFASVEDSGVDGTFEIKFDAWNQLHVSIFEPLGEMELVLQLLHAKFADDDFKKTFSQYTSIRQRAAANKRDAKFNPKQERVHQYLTELIFGFVGVKFDDDAAESRFIDQINNYVQIR